MLLKRVTLPFLCLLFALVWAGTTSAQTRTYLLGSNSGAQLQIGGGLPLPIQLTDANLDLVPDWGASMTSPPTPALMGGPGGSVFPPLLIPRRGDDSWVMGTTNVTAGQALVVPAGVLSTPGAQSILGVNAQNTMLYAVGTNLGYRWPASKAMLSRRTMTATALGTLTLPTNPLWNAATAPTVFQTTLNTSQFVKYTNMGAHVPVSGPFGGAANFNITQNLGGGNYPSVAISVYAVLVNPTGQPGCTHPDFTPPGIPNPACLALLLPAFPNRTGVIGGQAFSTGVTMGGPFPVFPNTAHVKAAPGPTPPKGSIPTDPAMTVGWNPGTMTIPLGNTATSTGFFWTTGMLSLMATGAVGAPETFILTGSDGRNTTGVGTLSLVSGAVSQRATSGPNANRGWVVLDLLPGPAKTPSLTEGGLAALCASLLAVAVFATARRRREAGA